MLICQLVSNAIDMSTCKNGIAPFLAHRKLKVGHCDQLIKLLAEHEAQAIDPFAEAIKADYIMDRSILRSFIEGIKTTLDADGRPVEARLNRPGGVGEFVELSRMIGKALDPAKVAAMKLSEPQALARDRQSFDDCVRSMLATPPGFTDRVRQAKALEKAHLEGRPDSLFKLLSPDYSTIAQSCSRELASLRATRCLFALRRWQLTQNATPTDLAEVCRSAGMPGVPVDPFSGSPLKLAVIDGDPVIYSVGPDGVDNRGLKDEEQGRKPEGDLLFRLPKRI